MVPEVMRERNERTTTLDVLNIAVSLKGVYKCLLNLNSFFLFAGKADECKLFFFHPFSACSLVLYHFEAVSFESK